MEFEILIILACVPLYVLNSFCDKIISTKQNNHFSNLYNFVKFFLVALCFLPMFLIDNSPKFTIGVIGCGIACSILYSSSKIITIKGYENSSMTFINFCHGAGMLIPCVLGHFFWNEKLNLFSIAGIVLAIISIVLLKDSSKNQNKVNLKGIIIGLLVFVTSGGIMIVQKLMGLYFVGESVSAYNFYSFFISFIILGSFLVVKSKNEEKKNITKKDAKKLILCSIGSAVSLCVINFVMTTLSSSIPSVVLFPLFNGLGIVCVCVGSSILFKEKMTKKKVVGLIIGLIGLYLVNF